MGHGRWDGYLLRKRISWSRRGWVMWKTALGGEVWPGHFKFTWLSKEESPSISTLECPCKSDSGQTNSEVRDCQALQDRSPSGWWRCSRVCPASGIPLEGTFKEEKKNLNCVELLYLLHFFLKR